MLDFTISQNIILIICFFFNLAYLRGRDSDKVLIALYSFKKNCRKKSILLT